MTQMLSYLDYGEEQTEEQVQLYETCLKGSKEEIRKYCKNGGIASQYIKDGMNPMHVVAIAGRPDAEMILEIMLNNGFDVNGSTKSGDDTVLHLIVEHVDVKEAFPLVLKILEFGPDLTLRNRKLRTPYDIALAKGEFEMAQALDGQMTAPQAKDFYKKRIGALYGDDTESVYSRTMTKHQEYPIPVKPMSPRKMKYIQAKLIDAVLKSKEEDIQEYLRLGADPNFVNEHKNGAIHYAITHCKLPPQRVLALLLQAGADVNIQDDEGDTALNLVIKSTRLRETGEMYKCAEMLVQQGALSTCRDLDGNDALALAKKRQYDDVVRLLSNLRQPHVQSLPRPEFVRPPLPVDEEDEDVAEEPPRRTPDVSPAPVIPAPTPRHVPTPRFIPPTSIREEEDDSPHPLPVPATESPPPLQYYDDSDDDVEIPQYVMNEFLTPREFEHPPPQPRDVWSRPPSETPSEKLEPIVEEEEEEEDEEGHLIRAVRTGTFEDVTVALQELGADPNLPDDTGVFPIHHVCIRDFEDEVDRCNIMKALLDGGADVNAQTVNSQSTALHIAATNNQDMIAQVMLDTHKCNYNMKNKYDKTPYEVAEEEDSPDVKDVIDNHRRKVRDRMRRAAKASICVIL